MKLWAARDTKGDLFLFDHKPVEEHWPCGNVFYECEPEHCWWLGNDTYPEVTFENSPQEVELKLINEIIGVAGSPLKTFPRVNEFEAGASYRR